MDKDKLEALIEAVTEHISSHWRGFRSWEDLVEELPPLMREKGAAALRSHAQQP